MKKHIKLEFDVHIYGHNLKWLENGLKALVFEAQDIFDISKRPSVEVTDAPPDIH
jgi:hypothetical protein